MDRMLFQPIEIKGMKLKNRLGFAPFLNMPAGEGGHMNDFTIKWFEERAKGGTALIMSGAVGPTVPLDPARAGALGFRGIGLYDDKFIPGFARLAEVIHSYDARLGVQIAIGGPMGGLGPSPPPYPDEEHATDDLFFILAGVRTPVREVSVEELEQMEDDVAAAAARAKAAGADCVELHCTHGGASLYYAFLSPYYNRRTDKYGGDWQGRLRFAVQTLQKMRQAVGEDFPIFIRISADQLVGKKGVTIEDTCQFIVPALEKAGVDGIDVSQGDMLRSGEGITIPLYYPRGCFIHLAAVVKQVTRLPVIGVARIVDLDMAEKFLQEGKADIIYLGRQVTCDPETPNKYFEGRPEDVRMCIGCVGGCGNPCTINYDIQDEPIPLTTAEKPKQVLVIGGGVGGMEAARIAALRGHRVTLMERAPELGGMVAALAQTPLTAEFGNLTDYLSTQMRKLKVEVRVCHEATAADVAELKPDVAILAVGSSPVVPEVIAGKPGVMTHAEASKTKRAIGQRVVVWGVFGVELAITLAEEGKDVVLLCRGGEASLGSDISSARKWYLLRKLTDINVPRETPEAVRIYNPEVIYNVEVEEITAEGIRIKEKEGEPRVLAYDTLILSRRFGERRKNDSLYDELQGKVAEVYKIGDCSEIRGIKEAIWSANEVARKI